MWREGVARNKISKPFQTQAQCSRVDCGTVSCRLALQDRVYQMVNGTQMDKYVAMRVSGNGLSYNENHSLDMSAASAYLILTQN